MGPMLCEAMGLCCVRHPGLCDGPSALCVAMGLCCVRHWAQDLCDGPSAL